MSGCSWWWTALAFVAGVGTGQVLLMVALAMLAGGQPRQSRDEHEEGF